MQHRGLEETDTNHDGNITIKEKQTSKSILVEHKLAQGSTYDITGKISHPGVAICQGDTNINTSSVAQL